MSRLQFLIKHELCFVVASVFVCCIAKKTGDVTAFVTGFITNLHGDIHRVNMSNDAFHTMNLHVKGEATAITLDEVTGRIYWSDEGTDDIWSSRMDGSDQHRLIKLDKNSAVKGISYDPIDRQLFFTDFMNNVISSLSTENSTTPEVILNTGLYRPSGIVAYYEKRMLIWTNRVRFRAIEKSWYNGTGRTTLVNSNTYSPTGITLDKQRDRVYWTDPETKSLESIRLDGTDRKLILKEPVTNFEGVFYFEGLLYLIDWFTNDLQVLNRKGKRVKVITFEIFGHSGGVAVTRLKSCLDGQYGYDCTSLCGHCRSGTVCNRIDGYCPSGCAPGWTHDRCRREEEIEDTPTSGTVQQMSTRNAILTVLFTVKWWLGF